MDTITYYGEPDEDDLELWFEQNCIPYGVEDDTFFVITLAKLQEFFEMRLFHRRHYRYPTYADIMNELESMDAGISRVITKSQFLYLVSLWRIVPLVQHEMLLAFKIFDVEKRGFLDSYELTDIVTTGDNAFDDNEVRELLRDADRYGHGNIYYEEFVQSIFSRAPELKEMKVDFLYINPDDDPSLPPLKTKKKAKKAAPAKPAGEDGKPRGSKTSNPPGSKRPSTTQRASEAKPTTEENNETQTGSGNVADSQAQTEIPAQTEPAPRTSNE